MQKVNIIIPTYYTVVVLQSGLFETIIADERHFRSYDDAKIFADSCITGIPVIIEV